MRYVLDSSVALKWVLPEPDSAKAIALRDGSLDQIYELLAPDIFPVEVAHALARAERKGIFIPPEGSQRLASILSTAPALQSYLSYLPRAFEIASEMRCSVYDCLYVSLAEHERCELVTADKKLLNRLQKDFPFLVDLSLLP